VSTKIKPPPLGAWKFPLYPGTTSKDIVNWQPNSLLKMSADEQLKYNVYWGYLDEY